MKYRLKKGLPGYPVGSMIDEGPGGFVGAHVPPEAHPDWFEPVHEKTHTYQRGDFVMFDGHKWQVTSTHEPLTLERYDGDKHIQAYADSVHVTPVPTAPPISPGDTVTWGGHTGKFMGFDGEDACFSVPYAPYVIRGNPWEVRKVEVAREEPKFKEGDWVIHEGLVWEIGNLSDGGKFADIFYKYKSGNCEWKYEVQVEELAPVEESASEQQKFKIGDKVMHEGKEWEVFGIYNGLAAIFREGAKMNHHKRVQLNDLTPVEESAPTQPKFKVGDKVMYDGKEWEVLGISTDRERATLFRRGEKMDHYKSRIPLSELTPAQVTNEEKNHTPQNDQPKDTEQVTLTPADIALIRTIIREEGRKSL